ncbi:unnamed protein product [Aspergillus oryzae var. brunneus]|uniref:Unnamed protein product n=1 Tax=Aspergillus oryzae var. brunneus TaxID=332754 RepID=A0ABQ6KV35_ASPOZ|nr:unnamed protein product [Aspergillus oryzae]GMG47574.1 unnamed protein product [Aspergillus oryzae var. brunneus]
MEWDPTQFFRDDHTPNPFALLILNQPINERAFRVLRRHDSITPDTRTHYANLGVRIIHDEDQYSTDFTKCLNYLRAHVREFLSSSTSSSQSSSEHSVSTSEEVKKGEEEEEERELDVLILGGLGGRVDQAFSQIHHLYSMTQSYGSSSSSTTSSRGDLTSNPGKARKIGNLYLISEESITFILRPGLNTIRTPGTNRPGLSTGEYLLEENVGIIPLLGPARITTSGFQWDVVAWRTEIGGQLSTSNHIRSEVVTVESVMPVLFTLELAGRLKKLNCRAYTRYESPALAMLKLSGSKLSGDARLRRVWDAALLPCVMFRLMLKKYATVSGRRMLVSNHNENGAQNTLSTRTKTSGTLMEISIAQIEMVDTNRSGRISYMMEHPSSSNVRIWTAFALLSKERKDCVLSGTPEPVHQSLAFLRHATDSRSTTSAMRAGDAGKAD